MPAPAGASIAEKYRLILFGRYPYDEQWRPLVATALMIALLAASCYRPFWSRWLIVAVDRRCWPRSSC